MKNLDSGKKIIQIINNSDNQELTPIRGKVFPLIADENTTFPFVVYQRQNYVPESDKDYTNETAQIQMIVAANSYSQSIKIANAMGDIFNDFQDSDIDTIKVVNMSEDYLADTFIQTIDITILYK